MTYNKSRFADELQREVEQGYDIVRISRWAYKVYLDHAGSLDDELRVVMLSVAGMEDSPEFELSESELIDLCKRLKKSRDTHDF